MRILLATDAWYPAVNGVVRTLDSVRRELVRRGHVVRVVSPVQRGTGHRRKAGSECRGGACPRPSGAGVQATPQRSIISSMRSP